MDFDYKCLDQSGKNQKGTIKADSFESAKVLLKSQGLIPIEINQKIQKAPKGYSFGAKKIKDADIYNLFRELSILLKSGIKLDKAFEIVIDSIENPKLKKATQDILQNIKGGMSLHEALEQTQIFGILAVNMVKAGESVGDVKAALENIAQYQKFQIKFKSEIKNALSYPIFLIFASMSTIFVIFKFIVPKFFGIFGENGTSLPLPAQILYNTSKFLNALNIYILIFVLILTILIFRSVNAKKYVHNITNKIGYIPLIGNLIFNVEMSRFSYSMYSMLNSGIEFVKALQLSIAIILDSRTRSAIEPTIKSVKEGKGIANSFSNVYIFPPFVTNMLKVGEESGQLKEIFLE
ncbi:MAG: type II secretion system F family protein, partial [Candidatus Micrarchaeaceae archaeon]